ncbi:MAG: sodium:proton antiporter [Bacteroidetes bacterium]|nr:MAG: sodium:proton antiporter [Bacteroidota bacterium]
MLRLNSVMFYLFSFLLLLLTSSIPAFAGEEATLVPVNPWMITPFVLLLLAIAVMPFINKHWWEKNYPFVSIALGIVTILYYLIGLGNGGRMVHSGIEYLSFIILIGSLFVVAGGIHIRVRGKSTPIKNVAFLGIGALISNVLGTTGASMILIRPFLRVNRYRLRGFHVIFFIFLVSNMGGALTPIGDPPLFLGYLKGVPFFWVLANVWHIWLFASMAVILIFYIVDKISFHRYEREVKLHPDEFDEETYIYGLPNIFFLAVILVAVFIQKPLFLREALMVIAATGSYYFTKPDIHRRNDFNFHPIKEVAFLFLGIFATMVPALDWLEMNAAKIGITSAGQFYWGTGILSSVLDNAPTYLNFLSASIGLFVDAEIISQVQHLVSTHGADIATINGAHSEEIKNTFAVLTKYHGDLVATGNVPLSDIQVCYLIGNHNIYLKAISIAAVFFGAVTYIGNGPNFMVKSIAEQANAECPSFFGYFVKYSLPILIPVFILVWWIWFK